MKKCIKCGFERDYKIDPCACGEPRYQIVKGRVTGRKILDQIYTPLSPPPAVAKAIDTHREVMPELGGRSSDGAEVKLVIDTYQETRIVDPKTGGEKCQKIERFDLIPFEALTELATIYGIGAKKYADDNWRKGYAWRLSLGAMLRHIALWVIGQTYDAETGRHHLMHAAWHCCTLFVFETQKLGTDDRAIKRGETET